MYWLSGGVDIIHLIHVGLERIFCLFPVWHGMVKLPDPWYCYLVSNSPYQIKPECIFGKWATAGSGELKIDDMWYQE